MHRLENDGHEVLQEDRHVDVAASNRHRVEHYCTCVLVPLVHGVSSQVDPGLHLALQDVWSSHGC